jgi:hypothetical protein
VLTYDLRHAPSKSLVRRCFRAIRAKGVNGALALAGRVHWTSLSMAVGIRANALRAFAIIAVVVATTNCGCLKFWAFGRAR